ncbi:MAG: hypothetical protein ACREJG_02470 [Candidatus Rokuibacteriota bacterium]
MTTLPGDLTRRLSTLAHQNHGRPLAVVAGDAVNALGVVRALGGDGIRVVWLTTRPASYLTASRFAGCVVRCPALFTDEFPDALLQLGPLFPSAPVLILTHDVQVFHVSRTREALARHYRFRLPAHDAIQQLLSKSGFPDVAGRSGLAVPSTTELRGAAELRHFLASVSEDRTWVVKPIIKSDGFEARFGKAVKLTGRREWQRFLERYTDVDEAVIVQPWIDGADTNVSFCLVAFDGHGRCLMRFTGRKIRQYKPEVGSTASAEPCQDPALAATTVAFFERLQYTGLGSLEFKWDQGLGQHLAIEPTVGRTNLQSEIAVVNGCNLPAAHYYDLIGAADDVARIARRAAATRPTRAWVRLGADLRSAWYYWRRGRLSTLAWMRSILRPATFAVFRWNDPMPFLCFVRHRFASRVRRGSGMAARLLSSPSPSTGSTAKLAVARLRAAITDGLGLKAAEHRVHRHLTETMAWLCRAQDATGGGGVARSYSLRWKRSHGRQGWLAAYPETTGYIIPTFFDHAQLAADSTCRARAIRMAEWEAAIQMECGAVQGGVIGFPPTPAIFNTGQVLFGWARAFRETGDDRFRRAATRAADFLVDAQDSDGAWRRHGSRYARPGVNVYDARTAWGLLEASRITGAPAHRDAAIRNLEYVLTRQRPNGWFEDCCLDDDARPLLHTLAYTMEGLLEGGVLAKDERFVEAARRAADAVLARQRSDGSLAGRFDARWEPAARWSCLTGDAQTAIVWLRLGRITGDPRYTEAAIKTNRYLMTTQDLTARDPGIRGGIKGSQPIYGEYAPYEYPNWAAKFFADALLLELRSGERG